MTSNGEGTEGPNGHRPGTFDSERGRKAGLASGAARRGELPAGDVPTDEEIERALRRKAGKGDVAAARVLLDMQRDRQPGIRSLNEDILSLLTDAQLDQLEAWITGGSKERTGGHERGRGLGGGPGREGPS